MKKLLLTLFNRLLAYKQKVELAEVKDKFKSLGVNFKIKKDYSIYNPQYIEIGDDFKALERFRIEAIDNFGDQTFTPTIKIGNNVNFNTDMHIGCINSIIIGDNCLFASRIFISDHNHGETTKEMLQWFPMKRPLLSKGPIVIKNNVWVGEGVAIMPNVTIGENCIIAANAVVTKDVPPNCIAAGVPAEIIKEIQ
ncbi:acyltransferase [Flavobacterium piscis]|uniref:Acetyltransferase-like isoleucine patch superfamily enzyme n=1 Tax=Flavobacterium piscis TaxID=1114874 RepID=A0ABU1Y402_9FLAO|nr:acyltransferase [Flavobacterium piscis]MDR7208958.1 acetyltransferase-like isoleucine patch superfamily enzyme [Flavobacterium piscis]